MVLQLHWIPYQLTKNNYGTTTIEATIQLTASYIVPSQSTTVLAIT